MSGNPDVITSALLTGRREVRGGFVHYELEILSTGHLTHGTIAHSLILLPS